MGDAGLGWGWVAALRDGSTTPWSQWRASPSSGTSSATARDLPGVQQLELLRRINLARPTGSGPTRTDLVDRVLRASAAGRGAPERELVGAVAERGWGLPPVDPTTLADRDLLRVAATLLAEDVVAAGAAARRHRVVARATALPRRVRRRLPGRGPGHRVVGDPWLAQPVRDEVLRRGRRLGTLDDPASTVVVLGSDVASMLVDAYTERAFDEGVARWSGWLGSGAGGTLPRRADLTVVARRWAHVVGRERVVVVLDPAQLAATVGLPDRASPRLAPARPSADATELARLVTAPLSLLALPGERRRLLRRVLLPMLLADASEAPVVHPPLAVPDDVLPWVVRRAEQMRDDLRAAGYPVRGDLQRLVPAIGASSPGAGPDDAGVLDLAIRLLLAAPHPPRPAKESERR